MNPAELQCPTCRAPWRGVNPCARCGTDLAVLMRVVYQAWQLREAARLALCAGNRSATALARAACRLHATTHGKRLLALALLADGHSAEAHEVITELLAESA